LFSHIVEHFEPTALLAFLDHYFTYAKPGALVLIATPLMSSYFYDDFDHIRPYHPESFLLAFGAGADSQMQFYGKTKLALVDLWYRRSPLRFSYCRGRHIRGPARKLFAIANLSLRILYFFTFRLVGRPDGWVGLFRCSSPENA
ncbi:MAG: class I SAM-dependent methyltransferase, partial [Bdellovibrionota bacterium]